MSHFANSLPQPTAILKSDFLSLKIHPSDTMEVIQFLMAKQVPFTIASDSQSQSMGAVKSDVLEQKQALENPILNVKTSKEHLALQSIYKKYIIDGIETMPPTANEIAEEANMSTQKFKALFMQKYGQPFYQLYVDKKMDYAALLLRKGLNASVISAQIGYSHPIKFNKMFQKRFGITPKKYQMVQRDM
jgi:AraC-like DNA-binding protein